MDIWIRMLQKQGHNVKLAMKDTGTPARVWLVKKLHTLSRKRQRASKQEVCEAELWSCSSVLSFLSVPIPSLTAAWLQVLQMMEGRKEVRDRRAYGGGASTAIKVFWTHHSDSEVYWSHVCRDVQRRTGGFEFRFFQIIFSGACCSYPIFVLLHWKMLLGNIMWHWTTFVKLTETCLQWDNAASCLLEV